MFSVLLFLDKHIHIPDVRLWNNINTYGGYVVSIRRKNINVEKEDMIIGNKDWTDDEIKAILIKIRDSGKWEAQDTTILFKWNNKMGFDWETAATCPPCVERVWNRLMDHFQIQK